MAIRNTKIHKYHFSNLIPSEILFKLQQDMLCDDKLYNQMMEENIGQESMSETKISEDKLYNTDTVYSGNFEKCIIYNRLLISQ